MCSMPAWPKTAGMRPLPITPSVRIPEPPPPPSSPIFPICSTPTASATSCAPEATPIHASRNAVEPVAQALATFTTGMPVCPTSWRMRCPTIAFAWNRQPAAISYVLDGEARVLERAEDRLGPQVGDVALRVAAEADHGDAGHVHVSHA